MTDHTGLGPLEVAVLRMVDRLSGPGSDYVRCADVLDALEEDGLGVNCLYRVMQDLTVWWRLHLPLLEGQGNFGSPGSDPPADAEYTEVRLSPVGRLALRSEAGDLGPVPLGLIEGTVYRGGRIPPFGPRLVTDALVRMLADRENRFDAVAHATLLAPALPTGGTVEGDLPALLRGDAAEMRMSCRIEHRQQHGRRILEITGFPLGVDVDVLLQCVASRAQYPDEYRGGGPRFTADIEDRTSGRLPGVRLQVLLTPDADPETAEAWLRTVWPVSIDVTWLLPAPMHERLQTAARAIAAEPNGLRDLRALL